MGKSRQEKARNVPCLITAVSQTQQVRGDPHRRAKKEHKTHFRVPRLSHAVVKEAEHLRFQELVEKIESHPHREGLHANLQQKSLQSIQHRVERHDPRIG